MLEIQQYPVHHAVGTAGGMEERIAEIIDVHHEEQDANRPHEVDGLAESSGIFLCHMGYDWLLYVNTSLVDPRAFPPLPLFLLSINIPGNVLSRVGTGFHGEDIQQAFRKPRLPCVRIHGRFLSGSRPVGDGRERAVFPVDNRSGELLAERRSLEDRPDIMVYIGHAVDHARPVLPEYGHDAFACQLVQEPFTGIPAECRTDVFPCLFRQGMLFHPCSAL